ncbi:MAG: hypothetical protein QXT33_05720 [Thermofilum sp.]
MAYIPKALLRRLYVKGSMAVTPEGLTFKLKNSLAPASLNKPVRITVDGVEADPSRLKVVVNGVEVDWLPSDEKPLEVPLGAEVAITVPGSFEKGKHKIVVQMSVKGYGEGSFDFEDEAA